MVFFFFFFLVHCIVERNVKANSSFRSCQLGFCFVFFILGVGVGGGGGVVCISVCILKENTFLALIRKALYTAFGIRYVASPLAKN